MNHYAALKSLLRWARWALRARWLRWRLGRPVELDEINDWKGDR